MKMSGSDHSRNNAGANWWIPMLKCLRVQARRVAQCYQGAGRSVPPMTARILADDTEERLERDCAAFAAWCAARGVECVRVLGVSEFARVA
jgi:hypothetical protein